ncbi:PhzF family phenazine biosynthesis protein [Lysinibacillus sp. NPDC097231]|uniref:PhzF family phenazine biosynthesis protein n=1 Tax=Lysinibacillus sp. NPDC097231 TaxID=3364142 RepID=UPI0038264DBD
MYKSGGIHAFTLDTKEGIAESRNFCPLYGINEEATTGTSNGALTDYLFHNKILNEFNQEYTFLQEHSMGRPSKIITKLINKNNPKVMVGKSNYLVKRGTMLGVTSRHIINLKNPF